MAITGKELITYYQKVGHDRFYRSLLVRAIEKIASMGKDSRSVSPEIELLNQADEFLRMYRRNQLPVYLEISKALRKAGHKIYRLMLKKALTNKNTRFLQAV